MHGAIAGLRFSMRVMLGRDHCVTHTPVYRYYLPSLHVAPVLTLPWSLHGLKARCNVCHALL